MGEQVTFWVSEWVSDCCLMPIELFFNFTMGEQVTFWVSEWLLFNANWSIFQLYHGRTSYFLSEWVIVVKHQLSYFSTLSRENKLLFEWVSDCCLTPIELFINFIMGEQVTFWVSDCYLMPIELFINFMMGEQVTFWVSEWLLFNA
jgi:hypothetical protein